jgi:hypothetical protein
MLRFIHDLPSNGAFRGVMFGMAISAPVWIVLALVVVQCSRQS